MVPMVAALSGHLNPGADQTSSYVEPTRTTNGKFWREKSKPVCLFQTFPGAQPIVAGDVVKSLLGTSPSRAKLYLNDVILGGKDLDSLSKR